MKPQNPVVVCKDGFEISIQASENHYCTPQSDTGPYTEVECGFPNRKPLSQAMLDRFTGFDSDTDYTDSTYSYVPVEVVKLELALHGGIVKGKMPE